MSFNFLVLIWIAVAIISFIYLLFKPAPYGRHVKKGWGPTLNNRTAWILMETPVFLIVSGYLIIYINTIGFWSMVLMFLFLCHYANRCLIYPFRLKKTEGKMPLTIVLSAVFFNLVNGNVLGYYFTSVNPDIQFSGVWVGGIILFLVGAIINISADQKLMRLKIQSSQYTIPEGGLYNWISCPNYFGEILEWLGFAIAGAGLGPWSFFIWTSANLVPRALSNHKWYRSVFPAYNKKRKAVLPFLL